MVSTQLFEERLKQGQLGEQWTFNYTCRILHYVNVPLSKIAEKDKGPRIYIPSTLGGRPAEVIVPDQLCMYRYDWRQKEQPILPLEFWLESKLKSRCSFYHINKAWQSGIDARCYRNYQHVEKVTGKPVWIFHLIFPTAEAFMNSQSVPWDKRPAPSGLYAHPISLTPAFDLYAAHAKMIYWKIDQMQRLASVEEVLAASEVAA
jgi:hypothetical protein